MKIFVTGAAGFIGFHLCRRLISSGFNVMGLDNINNYYDINLKKSRLNLLHEITKKSNGKWEFKKGDLVDKDLIFKIFSTFQPEVVVNLAAQAGVRYSIENPATYINSNIVGFSNILEACRKNKVRNLIYASSSSVYGGNKKLPFSEKQCVDHPVSLYAATKKANEILAHSYSHLYNIPSTGLRFFTVYGPWGRPDMAPMIFANSIINNKPIKIFNNGEMSRDFTFIDDIIEILMRLLDKPAKNDLSFDSYEPNPSSSWAPHQIFNLGNSKEIRLLDFIYLLEKMIGKDAVKIFEPMQNGDVKSTLADSKKIENYIAYKPNTSLEKGLKKFVEWYKKYY